VDASEQLEQPWAQSIKIIIGLEGKKDTLANLIDNIKILIEQTARTIA